MYPHQLKTITAAALTAFAFAVFATPAPAEPAGSFRAGDPYYNPVQDLRSPDTRDAALISEGLMEQPTPITADVDPVPAPIAAVPPPLNGFDWLDAAIGAAGALGLALIATGTTLAVRRRTRRRESYLIAS